MARTLFLTLRSPYARKASMMLLEKGLPFERVVVDLANRSPEFVAASPIGKVPVLVEDDGTTVSDSTVIAEYLEDRYPDVRLRGKGWEARLAVRQVEEYGDHLADQAVVLFFAKQRGDEAASKKSEGVIARLLDLLDQSADATGGPFCGDFSYADCAVVSALGYLEARHGAGWRTGRENLTRWADIVGARPAAVSTRPVM